MPNFVSYSQKAKSRKNGGGRTRTYYLYWRDEHGQRHQQATGCRDRTVAKQLAAKLERELALYGHGLDDPYAKHRTRLLIEHVTDFVQHLRAKGNEEQYIKQTGQRVRAIVDGCEFRTVDAVAGSKVVNWLSAYRAEGSSARSSNHYLKALQMFMNFLVDDNRLAKNPIKHIAEQKVDGDRRRVRRTLTAEQFDKLIQAAADGPEVMGKSGVDRAMLYLVAVDTGLRRGKELASLTPSSFDFTTTPPTVTVHPKVDKSRRQHPPIPLEQVGPQVQAWIAAKSFGPDDLLFPMNGERSADMLKADLAAAGISYKDAAGRVFDFHSFRSQGATIRDEAGWSLPAVQKWARHSTPVLTANLYCRPNQQQTQARTAKLPPLPQVQLPAGGLSEVVTKVVTTPALS